MVETCDDGVGHDAEAGVDGLLGVVENGVEVGAGGETEAGDAVGGAVENEICTIGEGGHAGDDSLRGLELF